MARNVIDSTLTEQEVVDALQQLDDHIGATGDAHGAATETEAGFMSPEDKSKLDGLPDEFEEFASSAFIPDYDRLSPPLIEPTNGIFPDTWDWITEESGFLRIEAGANSIDSGWMRLNVFVNNIRWVWRDTSSAHSTGNLLRVDGVVEVAKGDVVRIEVHKRESLIDNYYVNAWFAPPRGVVLDTAERGADGTTPHIGKNGNWWIGDIDTGHHVPTDNDRVVRFNGIIQANRWAKVAEFSTTTGAGFDLLLSVTANRVTARPANGILQISLTRSGGTLNAFEPTSTGNSHVSRFSWVMNEGFDATVPIRNMFRLYHDLENNKVSLWCGGINPVSTAGQMLFTVLTESVSGESQSIGHRWAFFDREPTVAESELPDMPFVRPSQHWTSMRRPALTFQPRAEEFNNFTDQQLSRYTPGDITIYVPESDVVGGTINVRGFYGPGMLILRPAGDISMDSTNTRRFARLSIRDNAVPRILIQGLGFEGETGNIIEITGNSVREITLDRVRINGNGNVGIRVASSTVNAEEIEVNGCSDVFSVTDRATVFARHVTGSGNNRTFVSMGQANIHLRELTESYWGVSNILSARSSAGNVWTHQGVLLLPRTNHPAAVTIEAEDLALYLSFLPELLNSHITINVRPGTFGVAGTIPVFIRNHTGPGRITIRAVDENGNLVGVGSDTHQVHRFEISACSLSQILIHGFMTTSATVPGFTVANTNGVVFLTNCTDNAGLSATSNNRGVVVTDSKCDVVLTGCVFENKRIAVHAVGGDVITMATNTWTNNAYDIVADRGSVVTVAMDLPDTISTLNGGRVYGSDGLQFFPSEALQAAYLELATEMASDDIDVALGDVVSTDALDAYALPKFIRSDAFNDLVINDDEDVVEYFDNEVAESTDIITGTR